VGKTQDVAYFMAHSPPGGNTGDYCPRLTGRIGGATIVSRYCRTDEINHYLVCPNKMAIIE